MGLTKAQLRQMARDKKKKESSPEYKERQKRIKALNAGITTVKAWEPRFYKMPNRTPRFSAHRDMYPRTIAMCMAIRAMLREAKVRSTCRIVTHRQNNWWHCGGREPYFFHPYVLVGSPRDKGGASDYAVAGQLVFSSFPPDATRVNAMPGLDANGVEPHPLVVTMSVYWLFLQHVGPLKLRMDTREQPVVRGEAWNGTALFGRHRRAFVNRYQLPCNDWLERHDRMDEAERFWLTPQTNFVADWLMGSIRIPGPE